jgi:hypothetical protein
VTNKKRPCDMGQHHGPNPTPLTVDWSPPPVFRKGRWLFGEALGRGVGGGGVGVWVEVGGGGGGGGGAGDGPYYLSCERRKPFTPAGDS